MNLTSLENRFPQTAVLVLVFVLLAAVCGEQAHSAAGGEADLRELSSYQLTMADVRKYAAANANLRRDPSQRARPAGKPQERCADEKYDERERNRSSRSENLHGMHREKGIAELDDDRCE